MSFWPLVIFLAIISVTVISLIRYFADNRKLVYIVIILLLDIVAIYAYATIFSYGSIGSIYALIKIISIILVVMAGFIFFGEVLTGKQLLGIVFAVSSIFLLI